MASWQEAEVNIAPAQSNQESEPNMSCIERLQIPVYPPLAAAARVQGTITATVLVASDGPPQTMVAGHSILSPAVDKAIRVSAFRKTCGGKSVALIFNFVLHSDPAKKVSFGYPNQHWISVVPTTPINQGAR